MFNWLKKMKDDDEDTSSTNTFSVSGDDDEYDESDIDQIFEEDKWEDRAKFEKIQAKHPDWKAVKVVDFTGARLKEIEEWLSENCGAKYERFGWYSNCQHTVGILFENVSEAVFFKLRWC